ncbi:MAG TPA: IS110 family transposase [Planctomycetota bacterium]|jgi:transposase
MQKWDRLNLAYVGCDVHKQRHSAVVLDCFGDRLGTCEVVNRTAAFPEWLAAVQALAPGKQLIFGLENTSTWGRPLAGYLLARDQTVRDVAPIRTARNRKRQPHPDKSDERDALMIARALMQDLGELPATAHDDLLWTLSLTVNQREGLVREQTRVKNRLHALLPHPYPDYAQFFSEPFLKTALAFWTQYPSPGHLAGVSVAALGEFLQEQSHFCLGRKKAVEILALATTAPAQREYQAERDELVRQAVAQLVHLQGGIAQLEAEMGRLVYVVGQQLDTLPGVDVVLAAELLTGIGDVNRFANPDKLSRYAGIAPKEWGSAGKETRTRSEHGRRSLHATFFHVAVAHIQVSKKGEPRCPASRAYYEKKLKEGKSKKTALTCLMRVLVRVVWRMLKHKEPYLKVPQDGAA